MSLAVYFGAAFVFSVLLVPLCRVVAHRLGLVATPKEDRWHEHPTALLGGVGIWVPVLACGVTLPRGDGLWQLIAAGAAMAALGLIDDLLPLKAPTKLIGQVTIASFLLFFGLRVHWVDSMIGDTLLTLFWIVGITNALNLLDNMDGLCGGITLIAGTFMLVGLVTGGTTTPETLYLATLLGATAGFLIYNIHPASVFMGDTGSLFLGLNLATITLTGPLADQDDSLISTILVPALLLVIPIIDTSLVAAARLLSGRYASYGGRDHTSHRLVAVGLSQRTAVTVLWALAIVGGTITAVFHRYPSWTFILSLAFLIAVVIFTVYLAQVNVYADDDFVRLRRGPFTPLVVNFMHKMRVAEVLLDSGLIPLAYYTAYRLRFEGTLLNPNYAFFIQSLPIVLAAQLVSSFLAGAYRGVWQYFGLMDAVVLAKSVAMGTATSVLLILYFYRFESYSRTVFIIHSVLLILLMTGSRASFRLVAEFIHRRQALGKRCVIYGTGGSSLATIREGFGPGASLKIVGFVDDNPIRQRARVSGYPVIGGFEELCAMVGCGEIDCVVLNNRSVDADKLFRLEALCGQNGIEVLRVHVNVEPTSAAL